MPGNCDSMLIVLADKGMVICSYIINMEVVEEFGPVTARQCLYVSWNFRSIL